MSSRPRYETSTRRTSYFSRSTPLSQTPASLAAGRPSSSATPPRRPRPERLPPRSVRWCALSRSLWCALVAEGNYTADLNGVRSIMDALKWRAEDTITEEEFTAVYQAWVAHPRGPPSVPSPSPARQPRKAGRAVHLPRFRRLLVEQGQDERALDLLLALVINEANRALLRDAQARTREWHTMREAARV